jgi:AcrR family transcriptional regulator
MPPKTKFSRESIVEAAFEIAQREGLSGITVRNVARRLGSSVAPIYVNFETIDDLVKAAVERIYAVSNELLASQTGPSVFARIGKASIEFARRYPILFRELSVQPNPHRASYETVEETMIPAMAQDENFQGWPHEELRELFLRMRVFHTGMATMVANDSLPSWLTYEALDALLMEVGDDMVRVMQIKREEKGQ